jgi:cell division inhibitor SepF
MNLEATSPEIAQRIIDFLSGTTYALDGNSQQLGKQIFLFTPSNVEIAKDHRSIVRRPGWFNAPGVDR